MIEELKSKYNLTVKAMCLIVRVSSSYYYRRYKVKDKEIDIELKEKMLELHIRHRRSLGREKMHQLLIRNNYEVSMYKVSKYLREMKINCKLRYKRFRLPRGEESNICSNLLARDFKATKMYQKIVTDVTEFKIGKIRIYLSVILDLYNNEILGYKIGRRADFKFIYDSIKEALKKIPSINMKGMIFHSDQGWAYGMKQLQIELKELGIRQSMSRRGNCYDNAVIESIFGHIKSETIYKEGRKSNIEEFIVAMEEYIYYYNNIRVQTKLKGYAPTEKRT